MDLAAAKEETAKLVQSLRTAEATIMQVSSSSRPASEPAGQRMLPACLTGACLLLGGLVYMQMRGKLGLLAGQLDEERAAVERIQDNTRGKRQTARQPRRQAGRAGADWCCGAVVGGGWAVGWL